MDLVLPQDTVKRIGKVEWSKRHPGLQLDKFSVGGEQTQQKTALENVCRTVGDNDLLQRLSQRRKEMLNALPGGVTCFSCTSIGPLTLHLSRASALENAGICLHPLYGFTYLPGSGLKGMARAYAETVWLPAQSDKLQAWRMIEDVFGWAPGSDKGKKKPDGIPNRTKEDNAHIGNIVFHDAWPEKWPQLIVDIVNNHHPGYYQAGPTDNDHPPGDWEDPRPVYFLAVPSMTVFEFALSLRRRDGRKELLQQAKEWLVAALCHLGAGAKTAAGYGSFRPVKEPSPVLLLPTREREATLELVTPAFLAGANQREEDCDLRPATLRGLLRWWWRTMHAGYVDVATLRRMEAALWGDTHASGAIRIEVRPEGKVDPIAYNKYKEAQRNKLSPPPNKKTTQGLWYHTFGMHDGGKQRHYLPPGSKWKLVFTVLNAQFVRLDRKGKPIMSTERVIPKDVVLDQAKAALWWLCALGGVGSKARKGFGNFSNPPELDPYYGAPFLTKGKLLRQACGQPENNFQAEQAGGPSLWQLRNLGRTVRESNAWIEVAVKTSNVWDALDRVGMAAQKFAQDRKHQREKQGLGLPRRIDHPQRGQFHLAPGVGNRHASPVHYHLHPEGDGFVLRVAAFPSARLPNLQDSEALLGDLLRYFSAFNNL